MPANDSAIIPDRETVVGEDTQLPLRIWLRLLTCVNMIEGDIRARLHAGFETTLPWFDILAALDAAGTELTMGELSARLMVTSGNVTGLINAMETAGLVRRRRHPSDRRSTLLSATEPGRALFQRMAPAHAAWIEQAMHGLDREKAGLLWQLLGDLKQSARRLDPAATVGASSDTALVKADRRNH